MAFAEFDYLDGIQISSIPAPLCTLLPELNLRAYARNRYDHYLVASAHFRIINPEFHLPWNLLNQKQPALIQPHLFSRT